ncbi:MAG TPA: hypothetical protein PKH25_05770 [Syntrophales bacterium]|nr:hypothetical protein [Syntrophales bacterium]
MKHIRQNGGDSPDEESRHPRPPELDFPPLDPAVAAEKILQHARAAADLHKEITVYAVPESQS